MPNHPEESLNGPAVVVGQVYRDTYGDKRYAGGNKRTVRIVEVHPNGVTAEVLTNVEGKPPKGLRKRTTVMFKTLRAGYVLAEHTFTS